MEPTAGAHNLWPEQFGLFKKKNVNTNKKDGGIK